jgi:hypothetical protein
MCPTASQEAAKPGEGILTVWPRARSSLSKGASSLFGGTRQAYAPQSPSVPVKEKGAYGFP